MTRKVNEPERPLTSNVQFLKKLKLKSPVNILMSPVRAQTVGKSNVGEGFARSLDRDFLDGYKGHCQ
jgi:hypothetical protein